MEKLPIAEQILAKWSKNYKKTVDKDEKPLSFLSVDGFEAVRAMEEFAKLHVKVALKAAAEKATISEGTGWNGRDHDIVDKESILTAYPLENIK